MTLHCRRQEDAAAARHQQTESMMTEKRCQKNSKIIMHLTSKQKMMTWIFVLGVSFGGFAFHTATSGQERTLSLEGISEFKASWRTKLFTDPTATQLAQRQQQRQTDGTTAITTATIIRSKNGKKKKKKHWRRHDDDEPVIKWRMEPIPHDKRTYNERYNIPYKCHVQENERVDLPVSIKSKLWFRTTLQTSLNILVMGDSVGMQIAGLLQEAMHILPEERILLRSLYPIEEEPNPNRHESLFWGYSPEFGGGSGGWRLVNMWLRKNAGKPLPEAFGGGWDIEDPKKLLRAIVNFAPTGTYDTSNGKRRHGKKPLKQPSVDVLVFRISQPWMAWKDITKSRMHKTVSVAKEQLNTKIVVFMTIPFSNNIVDQEDIDTMHAKNEMIKQFARDYSTDPERENDMTVVVWDFAQLNNALVQNNAMEMGYELQDERDFEFALNTIFNPKLKPGKIITHTKSIGHVCGGPMVPHNSTDCIYNNMITYDGQHVCLKSFGGRMVAGLACVIRCATTYARDASLLGECEDACNDQYMSLNELDESLFWAQ